MNNEVRKVDVKKALNFRMNQLMESKIIDDTGYSSIGYDFHIEVLREEGIVRYSMYGEPIADVKVARNKAVSLDIVNLCTWSELELELRDLVESACDIMDIPPREMYAV